MINQTILLLLAIWTNRSNLVLCIDSAESQTTRTYPDIHTAFNDLTDPENYRKYIPPPVDADDSGDPGPLYVNISIDMYNYAVVDEMSSEYSFHLFLDMEWFDPRLKFYIIRQNPYNITLEGSQYHIDRIWHPTVFIPNNQDPGSFEFDYEGTNLLRLSNSGYLWMRKRKLLRVYCDMDFHYYPFDHQICDFHLESSTSTVDNLVLRWNPSAAFSVADSFRTVGFTLKDNQTFVSQKSYSKKNHFSRVTLRFILAREWAHHLFLYYLPSGIIVVASWASFWLEITSPPARVSIGVTTMLALVTTFKNTKTLLPNVSYWNALDIWNMICIVFIFGSLFEFAYVNYIFNTEKRKKRHNKLKRKRTNTVLNTNTSRGPTTKPRAPPMAPSLETIFQSAISHSNTSPGADLTKRRTSSVLHMDVCRKSEVIDDPMFSRRASRVTMSAQLVTDPYKMSPEELANGVDRVSRVVFPLAFLIFNLAYWTVLRVRAFA